MSMVGVFARDENGKVKHKQPCQTPGCDYPNWHICLVGKPDTTLQILSKDKEKTERRGLSEAHREAISEAQKRRWAQNQSRDMRMVKYYNEYDVGYRDVARAFGVADNTAYRVLKRAEGRGEITMRQRGTNIRYTG